jgi:hypothetical protein
MLRKIKKLIKGKNPVTLPSNTENQFESNNNNNNSPVTLPLNTENQLDSNDTYDKLSDDVINQIKKFDRYHLTEEQKSLIDELIPNEELREQYEDNGLCKECSQINPGPLWCQSCNSQHFQQDFNKWTSGNKEIDEFIQNFQLNATCNEEVLEWIPYEKFENIEYLAKGGFGIVHKAKWIDGYIRLWNISQNKWTRWGTKDIVLKCLNNSKNLTTDFLQEVLYVIYYLLLILYLYIKNVF